MAEYTITATWQRNGAVFTDKKYSRAHVIALDGGIVVPASSSPHIVPLPYSVEQALDPEESFVSALSSCHLLWFLDLAAQQGFVVDHYVDRAVGIMGRNSERRLAMLVVTLHPEVRFAGDKRPMHAEIEVLHHRAHDECYIANSVRTDVRCEPVFVDG